LVRICRTAMIAAVVTVTDQGKRVGWYLPRRPW
jgi:hypothetical protein